MANGLTGPKGNDQRINRDKGNVRQGANLGFNDTLLFRRMFELAERRAGRPLPREIIPGINLESPKITRELSTTWFATRVDGRYRQCLAR